MTQRALCARCGHVKAANARNTSASASRGRDAVRTKRSSKTGAIHAASGTCHSPRPPIDTPRTTTPEKRRPSHSQATRTACLRKAAAFNLTQSLRALLAPRGVSVHAVLTGPTDTDMTRGLLMPKASPESVARAIFDGVECDEEDIFPDSTSTALADFWRKGAAKALEREYASLVRNTAA